MTEFVAQERISEGSLKILSRMIGRQVHFHASAAEVYPDFCQVQDVSICLGQDDFISLVWDWYDTKICSVDVFSLIVEEGNAPRGIKYENSTFHGGVHIETARPNHVERIHVLECVDEDEIIDGADKGVIERVKFDCGLVFEMSAEPSLAFGCEGSIAGGMPITWIPGWRLREYLREHNVRVTLDRENSIGGPFKRMMHSLRDGKVWPPNVRNVPDAKHRDS